jgi:hypothetical protein
MAGEAEHLWSEGDDIRARRDGWYIAHGCTGSRIRSTSEGEPDSRAVAFVMGRALAGDELARRAVLYLVADHKLEGVVAGLLLPPEMSVGRLLGLS